MYVAPQEYFRKIYSLHSFSQSHKWQYPQITSEETLNRYLGEDDVFSFYEAKELGRSRAAALFYFSGVSEAP